MFLTVQLAGTTYVVDPGLGGPAATRPIPLVDRGANSDGASTHWMSRDNSYWLLRTHYDEAARDVWVSTLEADNPIDFEVASHFMATHPNSPFRNRLMVSRFTDAGRVTIMNRDASVTRNGATETTDMQSRDELKAKLASEFGIVDYDARRLHVPFIQGWT